MSADRGEEDRVTLLVFCSMKSSIAVAGRELVATFLVAKVGEGTECWSGGRMVHPWLDNTLKRSTVPQFTLNKQLKWRPKTLSERRCNYHFCYELHASQREEAQGQAIHLLGTTQGRWVEPEYNTHQMRSVHICGLGEIGSSVSPTSSESQHSLNI